MADLFDLTDDVFDTPAPPVVPERVDVVVASAVEALASPEVVDVAAAPSVASSVEPAAATVFGGQQLLEDMFSADQIEQIRAEQTFQRVDLNLETDFRCPCCGYEWSGQPKPKLEGDELET